jgi:predicted Rossmann-fold nucleotide-binding protein
LSPGGYWRPFQALVESLVDAGFASTASAGLFEVAETPEAVFEILDRIEPPSLVPKSARF